MESVTSATLSAPTSSKTTVDEVYGCAGRGQVAAWEVAPGRAMAVKVHQAWQDHASIRKFERFKFGQDGSVKIRQGPHEGNEAVNDGDCGIRGGIAIGYNGAGEQVVARSRRGG
jgi:hypothetical protein